MTETKTSKSFIVSMILAAVSPFAQAADKCNALVMSGGGSNGAWEIGVIWGLLHSGNPTDFEWDYLTGISAGSINTAGLVGWAVGDELNATEWLSNTFNDIHDSDIWTKYPEGLAKSVLGRPSLLDDAPALEFLKGLLA
jgi:predicted acylesterase/phospholipase RssA